MRKNREGFFLFPKVREFFSISKGFFPKRQWFFSQKSGIFSQKVRDLFPKVGDFFPGTNNVLKRNIMRTDFFPFNNEFFYWIKGKIPVWSSENSGTNLRTANQKPQIVCPYGPLFIIFFKKWDTEVNECFTVNNNNFTNFKEFHDCPSPIVELALGTHHASTRMQSSDLGHA